MLSVPIEYLLGTWASMKNRSNLYYKQQGGKQSVLVAGIVASSNNPKIKFETRYEIKQHFTNT